MAYRGLLWPLRLNTRGDFDAGDVKAVIRSDIRSVLQTRRFVNVKMGGERLMRPGAFSLMPFTLMKPFDPSVIAGLTEDYIQEALGYLERQGKIKLQQVRVLIIEDQGGPRGVSIKIKYTVLVQKLQDEYTFEINTETPSADGVRRG